MTRKAEFTEIVLGFMRGDLTYDEVKERLFTISGEAEAEDDRDILLASVIFPLEMEFDPNTAGEDGWNYMRRMLAVIVGDLPMQDVAVSARTPGHHRLIALAGLGVLATGGYFAGLYGICAAGVAVGMFLRCRVAFFT